MKLTRTLILLAVILIPLIRSSGADPVLVDENATAETRALFLSLKELAPTRTLFGHQATMAYGYHWLREEGRSDVKEVTGAYPAVHGWDVGGFETGELLESHVGYSKEDMLRWGREALERGAVVTVAWHTMNPVSGGSFYDKTPAVAEILPGGEKHQWFVAALDSIAEFFASLDPMPVIFRPWHEHNGDWFWWGKDFCTEEEYIQLWRFTVEYLRDEKELRNLLYAFSPDRSRMDMSVSDSYFYGYPGDEYVDIIGLDNYWDVGHPGNKASDEEKLDTFVASLELIVRIAREKGKVAALTETGADTLPDPNWWTEVMLAGINRTELSREIAYLQVWRNANRELEGRDHFYVPYPGHPGEPDFIKFKNDPSILFEDELPELYGR